jgi:hypothetical protein
MRKVRPKTLERVNAGVLLISSGQIVKRLLESGRRGPRKMVQAAALRSPERPYLSYMRRQRATRQRVVLQHAKRNLPQ